MPSLALFGTLGFGKKNRSLTLLLLPDATCARSISCSHTQMDDDKAVDQWRKSVIPIIVYDVNVPGHVRDPLTAGYVA